MEKKKFVSEQHEKLRTTFRTIGPIFLVAGAICIIIAFIDFFTFDTGFGGFEGPGLFWLFFVGVPLLFIGAVLTQVGYAGAIAKYGSREYAPVVKETFNYLASETTSGVKEISKAIQEGVDPTNSITCLNCNEKNPNDSKFCKQCGDPLAQTCHHCERENSADALYCNYCGKSLG